MTSFGTLSLMKDCLSFTDTR